MVAAQVSINKWMYKQNVYSTYEMEYHSALKSQAILTHATI